MASSATAATAEPLLSATSSVRVSSTLNDNRREFGPAHVLDGSLESCWSSDQGEAQWLAVDLGRAATVQRVTLTFQGGFASTLIRVDVGDGSKWRDVVWREAGELVSRDSNDPQSFELSSAMGRWVRLTFTRPSDFFGRITLYCLQMFGSWASDSTSTA